MSKNCDYNDLVLSAVRTEMKSFTVFKLFLM